jgi:DNA polymerase-3 subunit epsilon
MAGFIVMNEENQECFSFGKYKGVTIQSVLETNPGYFSWIQQADFPLYTKKILNELRLKDKFS